MKIGITGAEGTIGSVLRKGLSNKYKIISINWMGRKKGKSKFRINYKTAKSFIYC